MISELLQDALTLFSWFIWKDVDLALSVKEAKTKV